MDSFEEVLARYGQRVTVHYGGGREPAQARCIFQPVLERRENWRQEQPTPLGEARRDRFLYLGEPGVNLEGCEALAWHGRRWWVRSAQPIYVGERLSHWWAVTEGGTEERDGGAG